jgi:hypothetical protein
LGGADLTEFYGRYLSGGIFDDLMPKDPLIGRHYVLAGRGDRCRVSQHLQPQVG